MQVESVQNFNVQSFSQGSNGRSTAAPVEIPQESGKTLSDAIIQFVNDQKSGRVLIQVVQPDSGEVILQIPSDRELAVTQTLGMVIDKVV
ncbi:MAG: flagellar protein FlaG [Nitrospirota bacterium]|mgnify:CR=1 FL=1